MNCACEQSRAFFDSLWQHKHGAREQREGDEQEIFQHLFAHATIR
jgi:hypothetical protein